jgi:hypothetical protein
VVLAVVTAASVAYEPAAVLLLAAGPLAVDAVASGLLPPLNRAEAFAVRSVLIVSAVAAATCAALFAADRIATWNVVAAAAGAVTALALAVRVRVVE